MKILKRTREEFTETFSVTSEKIGKMLKMIIDYQNKIILN